MIAPLSKDNVMKRYLPAAAWVAALLAAGAASAAEPYVEIFGGAVFQPDLEWGGSDYELDTGWNAGATVGWFVTPSVALEAEVMHTTATYTGYDNDLESTSLMLNAVYHSQPSGRLQPYLGAGVGAVEVVYDNVAYEASDTVLGWQLMGGVLIPVGERVSLFAEYRYQGAEEASDAGLDWEYMSHNVSGGLRFRF